MNAGPGNSHAYDRSTVEAMLQADPVAEDRLTATDDPDVLRARLDAALAVAGRFRSVIGDQDMVRLAAEGLPLARTNADVSDAIRQAMVRPHEKATTEPDRVSGSSWSS